MWWHRKILKVGFVAAALVATAALGACSFQPVYSATAAQAGQFALNYAEPRTRLEQVIYQGLAQRLGRSEAPDTARASVVVESRTTSPYLSDTAAPAKPHEVTVIATLTIIPAEAGQAVTLTRQATAQFTRSGQVLADQAAETDASERAARAVAEALRLAVLATRTQ